MPWTNRNRNKWFLDQIKPETPLEAKLTKLKLSYFRHIMRSQGSRKDSNAEINRRQQEKRKSKYEMD